MSRDRIGHAETSTGYIHGSDTHITMLGAGVPRKQRKLDDIEQLVHGLDLAG
jgi:hypothetical protein